MAAVLDERRVLDAVLHEDLASFVAVSFDTLEPGTRFRENWHNLAMAHHLTEVRFGRTRRLILNVPPRAGKSISVSVAYAAWALGHDPGLKIMCISYSAELARDHALNFRTIVESDWYRRVFPDVVFQRRRNRILEMVTSEHGGRFASGLGGSVLGRGADLIIIDDPIKAQDALSEAERRRVNQFYDSTLYTRLNQKTRGAIIIVMQRLHEDDLVGHVLPKEEWEVLSIPAIETEDREYRIGSDRRDVYRRREGELLYPEREPQEVLDQARRNLGSMSFSAQYQQNPMPAEGNVIKREWLRYYDAAPSFDLVMASWDTASTLEESADYSVGSVWGLKGAEIYLLDVIRGRLEVPDLRRRIVEIHQQFDVDATLIENTDIGRAILQELRRHAACRPIMWRPHFDKQARLLAQSPKFEAGHVLLPREAPWLAAYVSELLAFPNSSHDDQVDSTSQALNWLSQKIAFRAHRTRPNPPRPQGDGSRPNPPRPRTRQVLRRP